ncbi:MAG: hypothetical protein ACPG4T_16930 [Nannocystaceae bacterium]
MGYKFVEAIDRASSERELDRAINVAQVEVFKLDRREQWDAVRECHVAADRRRKVFSRGRANERLDGPGAVAWLAVFVVLAIGFGVLWFLS